MREVRLAWVAALWLAACGGGVNDGRGGDAGAASVDAGADDAARDGGGINAPDLASADASPAGMHDYGSDGPNAVTAIDFAVAPPGVATFNVVAYVPAGAAPCPVVLLSSGLQQPAAAYAPYAHRLATWGILTLTRDDPGVLSQSTTLVGDVAYVVGTWLAAQNADASSELHGRVDLARVGLAGHSRGGQVSLLAAEGPLAGKVRAVFGIDPVDSAMSGGGQARTGLGTIGVPTAFLGETTDGSGASACAPAADNYAVLYAAAASPSVAITALGADHTQFEDPSSCAFCTLCTAGSAQAATVLAYSVRYVTAFFARELLGDPSVDAALGSAGDVAAGLVTVLAK